MAAESVSIRVHQRHAFYYTEIAQAHSHDHSTLQREYDQIQKAVAWLRNQPDKDSASRFLDIVQALASYLLASSNNDELLSLCQAAFRIAKSTNADLGGLWLLQAQAHFAKGSWSRALIDARLATRISERTNTSTYGRAMLVLGQVQLNRGDYQAALKALTTAQAIQTKLGDRESVAAAVAERAAYFLNRGQNEKALQLYEEADRIRGWAEDIQSLTDHSLLMLGVAHRKLGHFDKSLAYLNILKSRGETENLPSKTATAIHHIAWLYLQSNRIAEARILAEQAKACYLNIKDPRGVSDAEEQLGAICLKEGNLNEAEQRFNNAIKTRQSMGNQQGIASTLRWMAILSLHKRQYGACALYFMRSMVIYARMNMLSRERLAKALKDLFIALKPSGK